MKYWWLWAAVGVAITSFFCWRIVRNVSTRDDDEAEEPTPPSQPQWRRVATNSCTVTYPLADLRQHDMDEQGSCWCSPTIQYRDDGEPLITHNSLDGREDYENGTRKPH